MSALFITRLPGGRLRRVLVAAEDALQVASTNREVARLSLEKAHERYLDAKKKFRKAQADVNRLNYKERKVK